MSDTTKIQWADATFNPWIGCTKVSAGCKNCYAENTTRARMLRSKGHETWGKGAQRSRTSEATWRKPLQWNATIQSLIDQGKPYLPVKVFPSLCDWLDEEVPIEWLADFLKLIHDTPNLRWLLLTKRPENWKARLEAVMNMEARNDMEGWPFMVAGWLGMHGIIQEAPSNVWFGVSAENQKMWDERVGQLVKIPAAKRFVSVEPMLEAIRFSFPTKTCGLRSDGKPMCDHCCNGDRCDDPTHLDRRTCPYCHGTGAALKPDWIIFGGESHQDRTQARPCDMAWIRDGVAQCKAAGVAAFVKQLGGRPIDSVNKKCVSEKPLVMMPWRFNLEDKKGGDMAEWPEDLRVREFPSV